MSGSLRSRLVRIREAGLRGGPVQTNGLAPATGLPTPQLAGWTSLAAGCWHRTTAYHSPVAPAAGCADLSALSRRLSAVAVPLHELLFFDLETTGLSGGTGTVAFLAAVGHYIPGAGFSSDQYFIDDYPAEPAMIGMLRDRLCRAAGVVTYNGATFDMPLFRTRCIMHGLRPPDIHCHLDLLHPARRLWRSVLPDCSLGTLERQVLGSDRGPDVPGSAIPEIWLSYIQKPDLANPALELVFEHNASDVRTLAALFLLVTRGLADRSLPTADPLGLAMLVGRVDPGAAIRILETALADGDCRAARPLMTRYWQAGRRAERIALARYLDDDCYGLLMKSIHAETVDADLANAIQLAERAGRIASASNLPRVESRLRRLKAKAVGRC